MSDIETISALVVDDENAVRSVLCELLLAHLPNVSVVSEAANIPEAVREIHKHKPQLIFLDIEMPGYSGLQLLEFFNPNEIDFDIIFVTAFNEYAIQAFKISAFDYILKPVNPQDLIQTVQRYAVRQHRQRLPERVALLKEAYTNDSLPTQLAVSSSQGIDFIQLNSIVLLEASGTYTTITQITGETVLSSKLIGEFESVLEKHRQFFRPHRSHLINLLYVKKFSSKEGDVIIMKNESEVPLSRYKKSDFEKAIASFKI